MTVELKLNNDKIVNCNFIKTYYHSKYSLDQANIPVRLSHKDHDFTFDKEMYFITIKSWFRYFLTCDIDIQKSYQIYARPKIEFSLSIWNLSLRARTFDSLSVKILNVQINLTRRLFRRCKMSTQSFSYRIAFQGMELRRFHTDLTLMYQLNHNLHDANIFDIIGIFLTHIRTFSHNYRLIIVGILSIIRLFPPNRYPFLMFVSKLNLSLHIFP